MTNALIGTVTSDIMTNASVAAVVCGRQDSDTAHASEHLEICLHDGSRKVTLKRAMTTTARCKVLWVFHLHLGVTLYAGSHMASLVSESTSTECSW